MTDTSNVPTLSTYSCPHCYVENPFIGPQRCVSCGLSMHSDQDQRIRNEWFPEKYEPLLAHLTILAAHPQSLKQLRDIQPILSELTPLAQRYTWLKTYLDQVEVFLQPFQKALDRYKKQLLVHLFLFVILFLAPALALLLGANVTVTSLLFLPVIGWGYLGLWQYTKPLRGGAIRLGKN